jgi:serine protease Do
VIVLRALLVVVALLLAVDAVAARPWAWLGVRIRDMSEQEMDEIAARHGIGEGFGVVIVEVMEDTPAARAGMKQGDIVVAFEKRPVTDTRLLQRLIARAPVDADIRLTVLRREGRRTLPVRLASMPRPIIGERVAAEFGFVVREADAAPGPAAGPGAAARPAGPPAVTFVVRGSAAERGGLAVGDVILTINDQAILTRDAARERMGEVPLDQPLRLTVRRQGPPVSLTLPAAEVRSGP